MRAAAPPPVPRASRSHVQDAMRQQGTDPACRLAPVMQAYGMGWGRGGRNRALAEHPPQLERGMGGRNKGHLCVEAGKEPGAHILGHLPAWQQSSQWSGWPAGVQWGVPGAEPPALCCSM